MSVLNSMLDVVIAVLVLAGAAFALIGAWGLARLPDFYLRLHAPTKVSTLGVGCALLASMGNGILGQFQAHEVLITLFVFMTAPVAAHLLAKCAIALDKRAGATTSLPTPLESGARETTDQRNAL